MTERQTTDRQKYEQIDLRTDRGYLKRHTLLKETYGPREGVINDHEWPLAIPIEGFFLEIS